MIKKGIILAGGTGSRMSPLSKAVNKQLLPIHDKPLIFYPLSVLMLSGIRDVLIIVNKGQLNQFKKILPNGNNLGIKISYAEQEYPRGLPDAFIVGKKFADFLPRAIIYPVVKYLIYFEYLIQKMFKSNRTNNIFKKTEKIARVNFESVANEKSLKKKSLRGFVTKNRIPLENLNIPEKVRQSLRAGL